MAQGNFIYQYHVSTGKLLNKAEEQGNIILTLDVTNDYQRVASSGEDGSVRVYDSQTLDQICKLSEGDGKNTSGHSNNVYALLWHPSNPQVLLSSGWDQTVQIWDLRINQSVRSLFGTFVCGSDGMDLNKSETELVTASWRTKDALQVWDFGSGRLIQNFQLLNNGGDGKVVKLYAAKFLERENQENIVCGGSVKGESQKGALVLLNKDGDSIDEMNTTTAIHSLNITKNTNKQRRVMVGYNDGISIVEIIG
eukprot:TRINITY_DN11631_c0_g1_i2.p2 TRINITY_DN11631_c0_g1~~TRINITY_DN11631_c0_g1_i2.p2  ORF type:complete len:252 (-),score=35.94 TRINITY_DN11631_c0_g1_i2:72-827(-)